MKLQSLKRLFPLVFIVFMAYSCENEGYVYTDKAIYLKKLENNSGVIKLQWTQPYINKFRSYEIYRYSGIYNPMDNNYFVKIAEITDYDITSYFDNDNIYSDALTYFIRCGDIESNKQVIYLDYTLK